MTDHPIDGKDIPERLIWTPSQVSQRREQLNEPFITGTYKWAWIDAAQQAGALYVALHLLRLSTMRRSDRIQVCATQTATDLQMSRTTLYRKLNALEAAGLVSIERLQRRWPRIEILGSPALL